ncbi:MAG: hypothetical protein DSY32_04065, partial [Aquifex sp.]
KETGFTQEDRERLIRLETTLKVFMEQVDKRFEQIDKRFEQVDKRFEELRQDMNARFELMNKRFEQLYTFLWIITGIFTTLTATVIAFAYWDRRTIIRKAKEETLEHLEREGKLKKLIEVLREKAKNDKELETILRKYGLL